MLGDCLASIARSVDGSATAFEVIVLFQQTSTQSANAFISNVSGVRHLHARLNLGFGGGNNFAALHARGKYLVFLNDDTIVQEGWLSSLISLADCDESIGAVGSRIVFPGGTLQEAGVIVWSDGSCYPLGRGDAAGSLAYTYVRDVDYASANGLLVRRDVFERLGGFDERFFPGYYEDVDLCMGIRHKLRQRVVYEPRSVILHRESATSNRDPGLRTFLFKRNQAQFSAKWAKVLPLYPLPQPESKYAVERAALRARGNPKSVLVVDDRVPSVGLGSGFGRTADLLSDVSTAGYAVAFAPSDRAHLPTVNTLGGLGVDLVTEPLLEHLRHSGRRYDIVILSRPHNFSAFHATIRETMPSAAIIYDVEALYHRRLLLQAYRERDAARRIVLEREADALQALEERIARSADRLVAISDSEVEWLQSVDGASPVDFMRPLAHGIERTAMEIQQRTGAVFVAGWLAGDASPNVEALRWYAEHVLPRVRAAVPNFVTLVSGGNPPLGVQSMACEGLELAGFVESVGSLYRRARVAIAPILAGAGVKIKTIEALQFGVPVVATTVGAEGLSLTDGYEIDISDDPAEYANRLISLLLDDNLWISRRKKFTEVMTRWESEQIRWGEVVANILQSRAGAKAVVL